MLYRPRESLHPRPPPALLRPPRARPAAAGPEGDGRPPRPGDDTPVRRVEGHPRPRHVAPAGLARLLAESGRRRRRHPDRVAASGGCRRRADPLPGAGAADHPGPDELRLRGRACSARRSPASAGPRSRDEAAGARQGRLSRLHRPDLRPRIRRSRRRSRSGRRSIGGDSGFRPLPPGAAEAAARDGPVRAARRPPPDRHPAAGRGGARRSLFLPDHRAGPGLFRAADRCRGGATG